MAAYRFAIHGKDGSPVETLGAVVLNDDAESMTFAKRIIRDLISSDDAAHYTGWSINITEGNREVYTIPFGARQAPCPL